MATESKVEESATPPVVDTESKVEELNVETAPPVVESVDSKVEVKEVIVEDDVEPVTALPVVETPAMTPPVAPAVHDPKYTDGIPQRVLELTAE